MHSAGHRGATRFATTAPGGSAEDRHDTDAAPHTHTRHRWHIAVNEVVRFIAFAATMFPAIVGLLALMSHLESNLVDVETDDESSR